MGCNQQESQVYPSVCRRKLKCSNIHYNSDSSFVSLHSRKYDGEDDQAVFQEVNASAHSALHTKDWFFGSTISVLDWSAKSSDSNVEEKCGGGSLRKFTKYIANWIISMIYVNVLLKIGQKSVKLY